MCLPSCGTRLTYKTTHLITNTHGHLTLYYLLEFIIIGILSKFDPGVALAPALATLVHWNGPRLARIAFPHCLLHQDAITNILLFVLGEIGVSETLLR